MEFWIWAGIALLVGLTIGFIRGWRHEEDDDIN